MKRVLIMLLILFFPLVVIAGPVDNTSGFAWNDNIGWIEHNSTDEPGLPFSYGVHIDENSGTVSGYAWSVGLGYIDFNPAGPYPSLPNSSVTYNPVTGDLSGWAQILSLGGSGWVKFQDSGAIPYSVNVDEFTGELSGNAWNDLIGWIDFAPTFGGVIHNNINNPSVSGWAWNDAYGWISTNSSDWDLDFGVNIDLTGDISGFAWSQGIGWIDYEPAGPYPSSPNYAARVDVATGQISGWAKAIGLENQGYEEWILMQGDCVPSCGGYGVSLDLATGNWSGNAWSNLFGWIEYAYKAGGGGNVYTNFAGGIGVPVLENPIGNENTYNDFPTAPLQPVLDWSDYTAFDGSSQDQYQIQLDDDPDFSSTIVDETANSPASQYGVGIGVLSYNTTYYWRVRVHGDNGNWSDWGEEGPGGESNSFITPLHAPPVCDFSMTPPVPVEEVPTQFTDLSQVFGGASILNWSWDFGDGETLSGGDPATHQNPLHEYATSGDVTIILEVTDSDGFECSLSVDTSIQEFTPEFRRIIPR